MPIRVNLDMMLVCRKVKPRELAAAVGITEANRSLLRSGKVMGVRFATLDAICEFLECQSGDILEFLPEEEV